MKKSERKRKEFREYLRNEHKMIGSKEDLDPIFEKAFELIKEGLVNAAINCTLDGDINGIYLDSILNEADWDNDEEIQHQTMLNKAGAYLSGSEEIEDQVAAIVAHKKQDDLIDFIDGVTVWEKVEFEFTVREFKKLIGYQEKEVTNG